MVNIVIGMRREDKYVGKRVIGMEVPRKRRRNTKPEVVGQHQERLVRERIVRGECPRPG